MKQLLSILLGTFLTSVSISQTIGISPVSPIPALQNTTPTSSKTAPQQSIHSQHKTVSRAIGTVLFSETFGSGFAGDGSNGAWTTNGDNGIGTPDPDAVWSYRGPNTTPNNTIGSRGAYNLTRGPVASPTVTNGFMIFDSDFLDNAGTIGAFGTGLAPTPHQSWLISPSFSTLGTSQLSLHFTTFFRRFRGDAYVLLSIDGGTTWGDSIIIMDANFGINQESDTDLSIRENANFIANQSNVKIAFYFDGISNSDGYYFVQIDDILVQENADNDLFLDNVSYQTRYDTGIQNYYTMIPYSQSIFDLIKFKGFITNNGVATQTNTKFSNLITTPNGSITLNSTFINLIPNSIDSLETISSFVLNQGIGNYSWYFSTSSDSIDDYPLNNHIDTVKVNVTDSTYARDVNAAGNFWYGSGASYELGIKYTISDTCYATSISILLGENTVDNEAYSIYLYNSSLTQLAAHEFLIYDTSSHVGNIITNSIPRTLLVPGEYYVTFKTYSSQIFFPICPFDANPQSSVAQVSGGGWGYTTVVPVIRLNIESRSTTCSLTASTSMITSDSIIITPTNGTAPYTYSWSNGETTMIIGGLQNCRNYFVTVTDVNGCVGVASTTFTLYDSVDYDVCYGSDFTFADGSIANNIIANLSYLSTIPNGASGGCDSIITQNLIVLPSYTTQTTHNICYGANFTFTDGTQELNIISSISHISVFTAANGCDSSITEYLTPVGKALTSDTICSGESFTFQDGTVVNNITSATSHTSIFSGGAIGGCDSIVEQNVSVITIDASVTVNASALMANLVGATYQWADCVSGNLVNGATNRIFAPTEDGIYQVIVFESGCADTSICYSIIIDGIVKTAKDAGINIYPNPISNELKINKGSNTRLVISIIDYSGKLVFQSETSSQVTEVDFSLFPTGVYLLQVDTGTGLIIQKLIKQ